MLTIRNDIILTILGTVIRRSDIGIFVASGMIQLNCFINGVEVATAVIVRFHSCAACSSTSKPKDLPNT